MKHGTGPTQIDHRDFDLHRSYGTVGQVPDFPPTLYLDQKLWTPNQNTSNPQFNLPPLPFGCTDFTTADLPADATAELHDPMKVENITHANERNGCDIRESLSVGLPPSILHPERLGWFNYFFNIQPYAPLDFFDAIRFAMLVGMNVPERRSVSWGTPWFPSWERAAQAGQWLMPMPTQQELDAIRANVNAFSWHNSKLCGWESSNSNGVLTLINKSWQGIKVGKMGFIGFDRATINAVMTIPGTVAFVTTQPAPQKVQTISLPLWQSFLSYLKNMLPLRYLG